MVQTSEGEQVTADETAYASMLMDEILYHMCEMDLYPLEHWLHPTPQEPCGNRATHYVTASCESCGERSSYLCDPCTASVTAPAGSADEQPSLRCHNCGAAGLRTLTVTL